MAYTAYRLKPLLSPTPPQCMQAILEGSWGLASCLHGQSLTLLALILMLLACPFPFPPWYLTQCHGTTATKSHNTHSSHFDSAFLQDGGFLRALGTCVRPRDYIHHVGSGARRCRVALYSATNVESWLMVWWLYDDPCSGTIRQHFRGFLLYWFPI